MKQRNRRRLTLVLLAAFAVAAYAVRQRAGIEWSVESIRTAIEGFGFWAPLAFVALVALRWFFFAPSQVVLVAAGVLFGFAGGLLYGTLGITLSGAIAYAIARGLGGDALVDRMPKALRRLLEGARPTAIGLLVLAATAYPVGPMTGVHFAAGLTRIPALVFVVFLAAGAFLRSCLYVYLGDSLVERGLFQSWPVLVVLALTLAPLLHPGARARMASWMIVSESRQ